MLRGKQQRFVDEYLIDRNATQAAIRAGYSEKTAMAIGAENLGKPKIAQAIAERTKKVSAAADVSAAQVIAEAALIAFGDMGDFVNIDDDGNVRLDMSKIVGTDKTRLIKKIKQEVILSGNPNDELPILKTEFELYDKQVGLEKLFKNLGLYAADKKTETDVHINGTVSHEHRSVSEARDRLERVFGSTGSATRLPGVLQE